MPRLRRSSSRVHRGVPEDLVLRTVVVGQHGRSSESAVARDLRRDALIARAIAALRSRASATQTISEPTQQVLHEVSLVSARSVSRRLEKRWSVARAFAN